MPSTQVVKPTAHDAYQCDGITCREVCESYSATNCNWIWIELNEFPAYLRERSRRWFCSYRCLSEWACYMQEASPRQTYQPDCAGLPF